MKNEDKRETQQEYLGEYVSLDSSFAKDVEKPILTPEQQAMFDDLDKRHTSQMKAVTEELQGVRDQMTELFNLIKLVGGKPPHAG